MNVENVEFLREFLARNIAGEHAMTHRFLEETASASLELRLANGLPTIATALHHAFASGPWFLGVVRRGKADWTENPVVPFAGGKQSLLDACRVHAEVTEKLADSLSPDELIAEVFFNHERFPAAYMADWYLVYLIHHRAMACSVLLSHGLKAPSFYGP